MNNTWELKQNGERYFQMLSWAVGRCNNFTMKIPSIGKNTPEIFNLGVQYSVVFQMTAHELKIH